MNCILSQIPMYVLLITLFLLCVIYQYDIVCILLAAIMSYDVLFVEIEISAI